MIIYDALKYIFPDFIKINIFKELLEFALPGKCDKIPY